jgi:hypothetical protein
MTATFELPAGVLDRVASALQRRVVAARRITRGYTPALRCVLTLDDGSTCFLKMPGSAATLARLRVEHASYRDISFAAGPGGAFMPRMLGWDDDGIAPLLLLEDLSAATWPPPWTSARIDAVLAALDALHRCRPPELRPISSVFDPPDWPRVLEKPDEFLALDLCTRPWLDAALPALIDAARSARIDGEDTLHFDVRSDNLCFADERAILCDWDLVRRGNASIDVAFWLPSLEAEGGPPPETILPSSPELAALISGFFAARAGQPTIPDAPRVRDVQREQLGPALRWAVRALGLPPLDGARASAP